MVFCNSFHTHGNYVYCVWLFAADIISGYWFNVSKLYRDKCSLYKRDEDVTIWFGRVYVYGFDSRIYDDTGHRYKNGILRYDRSI